MIKPDMKPCQFRIRFSDAGVERTKYTDDRAYYERLIAEHGHLSGLAVAPVTLTTDQQARLSQIQGSGLEAHEASVYVEHGTTVSEDTGFFDSEKLDAYRRALVEPAVRAQRKQAEVSGVALNGIRYSGDQSNRQALQEAIIAAEDSGSSSFATWKDSDGQYHQSHPVSEVKDALRKVGARRSVLIALEALYVSQVADEQLDIHELDWSTEYD